jgi:hypothetical protein
MQPIDHAKRAGAMTVALVLGLVAVAGGSVAPPPESNPGQPHEETLAAIAAVQADVDDIQAQLDAIEAQLDRLEVQATVDRDYCATGGVQCGGEGHGAAAPNASNHNPLRVGVLVTLNGAPVTGLAEEAIVFSNAFVPAGGPGAVELDCASCFQESAGTYVLFAHPGAVGTWKAGGYIGSVAVTGPGGVTGSALLSWDIPPGAGEEAGGAAAGLLSSAGDGTAPT